MSKQTITAESLYLLQEISDVQISPDGTRVAYVVTSNDRKTDKSENAIWVRHLESGEAFRLTSHGSDNSPRWSPDSRRIAFISRRGGEAQLYLINAYGGEAEHIKTEKAPLAAPAWSPDGQYIALKAVVERPLEQRYAGEPQQLTEAIDQDSSEHERATPVHVITHINYHADGRGLIYNKFVQLFVLKLASGECRQLTSGTQRIEEFIWNATGSALLYIVDNYCPDRARHTSSVYQLAIDNQSTSHILDFNGSLRRLDLAPGGSRLLLNGPDNSQPSGVGVERLWTADLHSASLPLQHQDLQCLTAELDASCTQPHWDNSGTAVYFVKHWHGSAGLCRLTLADGTLTELGSSQLNTISLFDLLPDDTALFVATNFTTPPELYRQQAGHSLQLTELHTDFLEEHHVCGAEKFSYQAPDGWDIEGWLVRPLNYEPGRRYPTILSVHGGPTSAYTDSWQHPFQLLAQQGFAVVFTNPRGSVTYGEQFTLGCVQDLGGKDFQDILAGLDYAIQSGVVDPQRVGITGWSYGGYMTAWSITQADRFRAAVAGACISNWVDLHGCGDSHVYAEGLFGGTFFLKEEEHLERSPIRYVENVQTPLLLLHGELDIRCPTGQSDQLFTALKRAGKEVAYVRYPGQYHGLKRPSYIVDRWLRTVGWFQHYLLS